MGHIGSETKWLGQIEGNLVNTVEAAFLVRLFEEYESYTTHPGIGVGIAVGVGVHVTLWLRLCIHAST